MKLIPQNLEAWGYCTEKIAWSYNFNRFFTDLRVWQTDGRTGDSI